MRLLRKSLAALPLLIACECLAGETFRIGGALGIGGSGLQQSVNVDGGTASVQRSEGPGALAFFIERPNSDFWSIGLEHSRGFSFAPFSMGASFTGVAWRYYFMGPMPFVGTMDSSKTYLFEKKLAPFIGPAFGVALADIHRENDKVSSVSGSGVYMGFRTGVDYPMSPGHGLRPEMSFSTTIMQSASIPTTITEFALRCGIYFLW